LFLLIIAPRTAPEPAPIAVPLAALLHPSSFFFTSGCVVTTSPFDVEVPLPEPEEIPPAGSLPVDPLPEPSIGLPELFAVRTTALSLLC
jgi:hypothetical protein